MTPQPGTPVPGGITEADLANYLVHNPGFFERHAELLASVQLTSPHGARAVSLQERQMELLRERHKGLERKIMEMIRNSQENLAISERVHRWTRALMLTRDDAQLPGVAVAALKHEFLVPQAAVRLWNLPPAWAGAEFALDVSEAMRQFAASLTLPYCGANTGFEAAAWVGDPATVASIAMLPLFHDGQVFGLLVLGSPDPTRYSADMGTEFLVRLSEIASAALSRLVAAKA